MHKDNKKHYKISYINFFFQKYCFESLFDGLKFEKIYKKECISIKKSKYQTI